MDFPLLKINLLLLLTGCLAWYCTGVLDWGGIITSDWTYVGIIVSYALFAWLVCRKYSRMVPIVYSLITLLFLSLLGNSSSERRQFLARLDSIEAGMSRENVATIMDGYMTGTGLPGLPGHEPGEQVNVYAINGETIVAEGPQGAPPPQIVFRYDYSADWGVVYFDGRNQVSDVRFYPD